MTERLVTLYEVDEEALADYLRSLAYAVGNRDLSVSRLEHGKRVGVDDPTMTRRMVIEWNEPAGAMPDDALRLAQESLAENNEDDE